MGKIYEIIKQYNKISIIGMGKNVGKTTVLNEIISQCWGRKNLGITSIGRDGEEQDLVTNTKKPKIYVKRGTIIATARKSLSNCDITKEILHISDIVTPMGNVIIIRALSDGYVDIAGPSYNLQIQKVLELFSEFGAEISIVDGALSRKGSAAATVCQGNILVTGAAVSNKMEDVIEKTLNTVKFLEAPLYNGKFQKILKENIEHGMGSIIYSDGTIEKIGGGEFLQPSFTFKELLKKEIELIGIKGAVTDKFIEFIMKNRNSYKEIDIVSLDGTKFFIGDANIKRAELSGIRFKILEKSNLLLVAYNPISPTGYEFLKDDFRNKLEKGIKYPLIDVMEEKNEIYR